MYMQLYTAKCAEKPQSLRMMSKSCSMHHILLHNSDLAF